MHIVPEPATGQPATANPLPPQPAPAPVKQERRAQLRREVDTSVTIFLIKGGSTLTGRIIDLSPSGCRIRTDKRFPVGIYTRVETEFRFEGLPFRLGGVIQAIHNPFSTGIRFLDLSDRKREQLTDLIAEIDAMNAQVKAAAETETSHGGVAG